MGLVSRLRVPNTDDEHEDDRGRFHEVSYITTTRIYIYRGKFFSEAKDVPMGVLGDLLNEVVANLIIIICFEHLDS